MSKARRLGVVLASLTLALVAVSPAWAATLHQTGPIAWTDAPQGSSADCAGALAQPAPNGTDVPAGSVLWRFTLVDNDPQNTPPNPNLTLTVQFTDSANNDQPITISVVDWVS